MHFVDFVHTCTQFGWFNLHKLGYDPYKYGDFISPTATPICSLDLNTYPKSHNNALMCYLDRFVRQVDKSPKSGIAQTLRCMLSPVTQSEQHPANKLDKVHTDLACPLPLALKISFILNNDLPKPNYPEATTSLRVLELRTSYFLSWWKTWLAGKYLLRIFMLHLLQTIFFLSAVIQNPYDPYVICVFNVCLPSSQLSHGHGKQPAPLGGDLAIWPNMWIYPGMYMGGFLSTTWYRLVWNLGSCSPKNLTWHKIGNFHLDIDD